jgi:kinesin family member 2/24
MVVKWSPPPNFPFTLPGMNLVVVLSAAASVGEDVGDVFGKPVAGQEGKKFLCAMVGPAMMPEAYDIHLWQQVVVDVEAMEAEVVLEYDMATRYYYLTI